ncbi:hypothetical protein AVEN_25036-1, partial [Araneus ventricosus]
MPWMAATFRTFPDSGMFDRTDPSCSHPSEQKIKGLTCTPPITGVWRAIRWARLEAGTSKSKGWCVAQSLVRNSNSSEESSDIQDISDQPGPSSTYYPDVSGRRALM